MGPAAYRLLVAFTACAFVVEAARVDLGGALSGLIADGPAAGGAARAGAAQAPAAQSWFTGLRSRRLGLDEERPVEPHGSCRLHVYHPPPPSMTATLLCNGRDDAECSEPCIEGYTRRSKGLCHQHCPASTGPSEPSERCPGVMVCIRPGLKCPYRTGDVLFWCPSPEALLESCAKHEYVSPLAKRPKDAPCHGALYRDFLGRWQCGEAEWREPCRPGYNESNPAEGTCTQACPPWLINCGSFCSSPKSGCATPPRELCPLGALKGCGAADRSESMLATACAAEGYRSTTNCPLILRLHGGCGGSRLMLASGLRAQGNVIKIEAWWEGGQRQPAAGQAGQMGLLSQAAQQQQQQQQIGEGQQQDSKQPGQQQQWKEDPPLVNFLPHTQMPNFREPAETVLTAVRVTFARGLTQVLGNETAASATSPRASYAFADGEAITRLTVWSSERALDGATLTPLVGGLSFTTSKKGAFAAGQPPSGPPLVPVVRPAPSPGNVSSNGSSSGQQQQQQQQQQQPQQQQEEPDLDWALIGGGNVTMSGSALGAGLLVGVSAYTSGSVLNALGFIFIKGGGADRTEL